MDIIKKIIQNNFTAGRVDDIKMIIMHTQDGQGSIYDWFNNPSTQASAHFWVSQGGIVEQYVEEFDTAWNSGDSYINAQSIAIEHEDFGNYNDAVRTDILYENSAQLIAYLCKKYEQVPCVYVDNASSDHHWDHGLRPHRNFVNVACPGGLNVQRIVNRANEIINDASKPVDPIPPKPTQPPVINISFEIVNNGVINVYSSLIDAQKRFEALKLELQPNQDVVLNQVTDSGSSVSKIRINYYKKEMDTTATTTTVVTTPSTTTVTQTPIVPDINLDDKKVSLLISLFTDLFTRTSSRKLGITLLFNLIIVYGVYEKIVPVEWYSVLALALVDVVYMITNILDKNQG